MPATPQDRLYGLTTSVAVKPPVYISADYDITRFGEQTITSKTPTDERTITTTEGMRVLLLGQDNPVENGIWVARRSFWVRATDFNGPRDAVNGTLVFSINGDCWQVEADDPVVIGKSVIHFRPTYPFEANLDIFQRTLRVPEASVGVLPSAEDRAWKGLGFDGAGQPKLQDPAGTGLWGYVPAIGSFEKGSLLTQRFEVLLWESTDEYWRWDGEFPKSVSADSTPETAGGTGKGMWIDVTDATLRANLGSDEEGLGGDLVGFSRSDIGYNGSISKYLKAATHGITPDMFGYVPGSTVDATPYVQLAINASIALKLPCELSGHYYFKTLPVTLPLPGDDGTAYPAWVTAGTDSNISPEVVGTLNSCLDLSGGPYIRCAPGTVFEWAGAQAFKIASPTVSNTAPVFFTAKSRNAVATRGITKYKITGHPKIKGFFIGRVVAGIINDTIDECWCVDTGISGIWQGGDAVQFNGLIEDRNCRVGHVYGGWWTQRNRVSSNGGYLPPYPAGDIYDLGWLDSVQYQKYHFYHYLHRWDTYDQQIDQWFESNFFKSANSATYSAGGRATNGGTVDLTTQVFPGIAGRSLVALSRYKANLANLKIQQFKMLGSFYMPVYVDPKGSTQAQMSEANNADDYNGTHSSRAHIDEAYVERVALLDTSLNSTGLSNRFYENNPSGLSTQFSVAPSTCAEGNVAVRFLHQSGAVVTQKPNYAPQVLSGPILQQDISQDGANKLLYAFKNWRVDLNTYLKPYKLYSDYSIQKPVYYDLEGYGLTSNGKFYYRNRTFTPVVTVGGSVVTLSNADGRYNQTGGLVTVHFRITIPSTAVTASKIQITNLPMQSAGASSGQTTAPVTVIQTSAAAGLNVFARVEIGTQTLSFVTDSIGTDYIPTPGASLTLMGTISYQLNSW